MDDRIHFTINIDPQQQGSYFTLPFTVPPAVESLTLKYSYGRRDQLWDDSGAGTFTGRPEINTIDLGLIAPNGAQVGASGSDKTEIFVSETTATPGYRPCPIIPGAWQILVGAYKIHPDGALVTYEIELKGKQLRLLKGDLHTHTIASDGVLTAEELGWRALRHGLDFLAITDHNQPVSQDALPRIPGLTLIPGIEWTHYKGHANFTGVDRPYDEPFAANTPEEVTARFESARSRGALITINHPFEDCCPFLFDLNSLPFHCLEVWNGPMRESNLRAVGLWHSMLTAGKKIPIVGGSDFHRDTPFLFPGGPTTCVYAQSAGASDILAALRQGHSYIAFAPNGPSLNLTAGEEAILGDTVTRAEICDLRIEVDGLTAGDVLRVVTQAGAETLLQAPSAGSFSGTYTMKEPGFARVEILRSFLPGVPLLPALLSNPIYFE